jgi:hypothetical protein
VAGRRAQSCNQPASRSGNFVNGFLIPKQYAFFLPDCRYSILPRRENYQESTVSYLRVERMKEFEDRLAIMIVKHYAVTRIPMTPHCVEVAIYLENALQEGGLLEVERYAVVRRV